MPKYINIITYCADVTGFKDWLISNCADKVLIDDDGNVKLHKNIIGAWYDGKETIAFIRCNPEEIYVGDEEAKPGWLRRIPQLEIWAEGGKVWDCLTPEQLETSKRIIGLPVDGEGNEIEQDPFRPASYAGAY